MADLAVQTPATAVPTPATAVRTPTTVRRSILRSAPNSAFRTPDRRRFGPLGSSWHTRDSRVDLGSATSSPLTTGTSKPGQQSLASRLDAAQSTSSAENRGTSRLTDIEILTQTTEIEKTNIMGMTRKVWNVFRVTPLYNFQDKQSDLQYYSRMLSSQVAAESKRGLFIDTSEPGDAVVALFSGLNVGKYDPKAVLIEIKTKAKNKDEEKVISQAVLFSTDLEYNPLKPSLQSHFTYFSNILIRGPETLSQTIQNWIEVQFDCKVVAQTFRSHELAFMAAMFTGFNEVHKPLELAYGVPAEVEGLSNIDYSTKAEDCLRLWNRIHDPEVDSFTSSEAQTFISCLEGHFYEIFNIKLNAMPLLTVGTSIAFVGRDGKIKLHAKLPVNVLKALRHLTDLALDQLKVF